MYSTWGALSLAAQSAAHAHNSREPKTSKKTPAQRWNLCSLVAPIHQQVTSQRTSTNRVHTKDWNKQCFRFNQPLSKVSITHCVLPVWSGYEATLIKSNPISRFVLHYIRTTNSFRILANYILHVMSCFASHQIDSNNIHQYQQNWRHLTFHNKNKLSFVYKHHNSSFNPWCYSLPPAPLFQLIHIIYIVCHPYWLWI